MEWASKIRRVGNAVARRTLRSTRITVCRALSSDLSADGYIVGYRLVRLSGRVTPAEEVLIRDAMRTAGESVEHVADRLPHGDIFFGWQREDRIVSFGWARFHDRWVGPVRMVDAPNRVYIYNFQTLPEYRRQGLYLHLLLAIPKKLAGENPIEVMVEVNRENQASARVLKKAGFLPVGEIRFWTLLSRWPIAARKIRFGVPGLASW